MTFVKHTNKSSRSQTRQIPVSSIRFLYFSPSVSPSSSLNQWIIGVERSHETNETRVRREIGRTRDDSRRSFRDDANENRSQLEYNDARNQLVSSSSPRLRHFEQLTLIRSCARNIERNYGQFTMPLSVSLSPSHPAPETDP